MIRMLLAGLSAVALLAAANDVAGTEPIGLDEIKQESRHVGGTDKAAAPALSLADSARKKSAASKSSASNNLAGEQQQLGAGLLLPAVQKVRDAPPPDSDTSPPPAPKGSSSKE